MGTLIDKNNTIIKIEGFYPEHYRQYNFLNLVLSQTLLSPSKFSFTMQKKKLTDTLDDSDFPIPHKLMGSKVQCVIGTIRFDGKDAKVYDESIYFEGFVFDVQIYRRSDLYSEQLIDVTVYSPDYRLIDHPHCWSHENMTLEEIVKYTLGSASVPPEINTRTTDKIPYTVQYNESNYQFLTRLAQRYGEWMYYNGEKLIFGKIQKKDTIELESRNGLLTYRFQAGIVHHNAYHLHHDYLKYETLDKCQRDLPDLLQPGYHALTDRAKNVAEVMFPQYTNQHLQCSNPEEKDGMDELEISIKAQLYGEKTQQVVCTGSSVYANLAIGSKIIICDHYYNDKGDHKHEDIEELMIIGITHSTEMNGNYVNHFTAVPAKCEYPPYSQSDIFPVAPPQRAKVMDNNDPKQLGRIRVQFLWQDFMPDMMSPWIRIAQPHGGDDKGFYFIPEIDEEVMVDFENGNAEKPYVVGTLYYGKKDNDAKQRPDEKWPTETNDIKAIRTRNGHTIEIHDEGDDGFIRIYDHKKENYVLTFSTDEKLIKLESTGNIELYAEKDIIMKAGGNRISTIAGADNVSSGSHHYKAEGAIHIEGKSFYTFGEDKVVLESPSLVQIQSDATANVLGNGSVLVGSGGAMEVSAGSTLKVEAQATMDLKAGAPMTLDAPIVNIN